MKRAAIILALGLLLGGLAGAGVYLHETAPQRAMLCCQNPDLAWLQQEYQLTDAQLARVAKLHADYEAGCMEMCRRISATNELINIEFTSHPAPTPAMRSLLAGAGQLRADCQLHMLEYCQAVSREMSPEQGRRYLAWMSGQVLNISGAMPMAAPMSMSP